jgi:hypothetical protein
MLQGRLRNITLGLYGRLFLSRCMQVLARRKTGVMLKQTMESGLEMSVSKYRLDSGVG